MTDGLHLEDLCIYRDDSLLLHINAHIPPGEALTVMGPSGVGKSTLLSAITGTLQSPFRCEGIIQLDGQVLNDLPAPSRKTGLMLQEDLLFPHLSVGGNLAFGLSRDLRGRRARMQRVKDALAEIGLAGFEARDPATLSGGQKARVSLMRVLLSEPRALLLDEPFSRLDKDRRDQIRRLVFDQARRQGLPVLLVTHDSGDAQAAGGKVIELA